MAYDPFAAAWSLEAALLHPGPATLPLGEDAKAANVDCRGASDVHVTP